MSFIRDDSALVNTFFLKIDFFLIFPLCLELTVRFFLSSSKSKFLLSLDAFVPASICVGLIGYFLRASSNFLILYKCSICIRSLKCSLYLYNIFEEKIRNEVRRQIALIVMTVFILIIFNATLLELFENYYRRTVIGNLLAFCQENDITKVSVCLFDSKRELSFHQWIYFVIVTLSTVGYGDIVPTSVIGTRRSSNSRSHHVDLSVCVRDYLDPQTNRRADQFDGPAEGVPARFL